MNKIQALLWSSVFLIAGVTADAADATALVPTATYVYDGTGAGAQPSSKPGWPDSSGNELLDGVIPATTGFKDPRWVGFLDLQKSDESHPQLTIDLHGSYTLSHLEVVYLHSTSQAGGSITAPEQVQLSFADDGTHFTAGTLATPFDHSDGDAIRTAHLDIGGGRSRYVRLDFRNNSQWTFLAEVRVYATVASVAHAQLRAAIETAERAYKAAEVGQLEGQYKEADRETLGRAIAQAKQIDKNTAASTAELKEATEKATSAINHFERAVNGGIPPLHHILVAGQSLSVGWSGGPPLSMSQPYRNLMLSGVGQTGRDLVPLVEGPNLNGYRTETISSALANGLTAQSPRLRYRSIVTRNGQGGAPYAALKKGTKWYTKGLAQIHNAKTASEKMDATYVVDAIALVHGESDHLARRGALYEQYLKQWQADYEADIQAITGQSQHIPMFLCQMSSHTMYKTATSLVPQAQLSACTSSPMHYLVCPKYFLTYSDGVHLTGASYRHLGEYYAKAMRRVLIDKKDWQPLRPTTITIDGAIITVDFLVPAPPLCIDTEAVMAQTNYGFEYADSTSSATITAVEITDADTITITLNKAPTGENPVLHYARTGVPKSWSGWNQTGAARGNIRDSDPSPSAYGNILYNWLVHFDWPLR